MPHAGSISLTGLSKQGFGGVAAWPFFAGVYQAAAQVCSRRGVTQE